MVYPSQPIRYPAAFPSPRPLRSARPVMGATGAPAQMPLPTSVPASTLQDHFLDPQYSISSQQALGLFTAGLVFTFAGRSMLNYLMSNKGAAKQAFEPQIMDDVKDASKQLTIYQNYNDALSSIYRIIHMDPKQGDALLVYAGTCILGYLSGSVVQGGKETWVRREETKIRASLVNRLQNVVRQSIGSKTQFNNTFKEEMRSQIVTMLEQQGIPDIAALVQDVPIPESAQTRRHFFYEPTHRTVAPPNLLRFGETPWEQAQNLLNPVMAGNTQQPSTLIKMQKGLIVGLGAFTGFVLQGFVKLMRSKEHLDATIGKKSVWESVQLKDKETWALIGSRSRKNFAVMAGFFAMSAAASVGKTLLDGLKEIEVTRLNARTELDYQTHNWLTQDPAFHEISERETAKNDLWLLEKDLPCLKYDRTLLRQRVQAILTNVGRNSAPPYFPMTPMVGLVEARA